jgi:hypothetical protein
MRYGRSKYGSKKVTVDGVEFDSKREAARYKELKVMEAAGEIEDLQLQVHYELIPAKYETFERYGKRGQRLKDGCRLIEKSCCYVADFVYTDCNGRLVVEDSKGHKTKDYIIKRKLMLNVFGIRINEV